MSRQTIEGRAEKSCRVNAMLKPPRRAGISVDEIPYKDALASFKRDCDEINVIAKLLCEQFSSDLAEPLLDVGAGSGELVSLAFPDLAAVLIDIDDYGTPANPKHKRIIGDFLHADLSTVQPRTILFCHSATYVGIDAKKFSKKLVDSGAEIALVVSNENGGVLGEIVDLLQNMPIDFSFPFHVPMPRGKLERKVPFSAKLTCADIHTMAEHIVRVVLDLPSTSPALSAVDQHLRSLSLPILQIEIAQAIYSYRLQH
jgi:hypothetical protein